jgi:5-hydroxyisourate hydrolase-like protein (transthyretin family)
VAKRALVAATMALLVTSLLPGPAAYADPTKGSVVGHFRDGTTPMTFTTVYLIDPFVGQSQWTTTDTTGAFSFTDVTPGSYEVMFMLPGFGRQFVPHTLDEAAADRITVTAGGQTTVEETVVPHGGLTGHVQTATGLPVRFGQIFVHGPQNDYLFQVQTDNDGNYTFPIIPPGTYRVEFVSVSGSQHDTTSVTVSLGQTATANHQFAATGAITGHLTKNGQPEPFASISLYGEDGTISHASTDSLGAYRLDVLAGTYTLQFRLANGFEQWYPGKTSQSDAQPITVTTGTDSIVDEEVMQTGLVTGRLTAANGTPLASTSVYINGAHNVYYFANTDANGTWQAVVAPGTYKVSFQTQNGNQYARGKSSEAAADPVVVAANQTVTVDDRLAAGGTITVTARNSVTGAPLTKFCASFSNVWNSVCTTTGTATLTGVLPATGEVSVSIDSEEYLYSSVAGVVVRSNQNTAVLVNVVPAATISTIVRDRASGAPVAGICVEVRRAGFPTGLGGGQSSCSDATGKIALGYLEAGSYNLFAWGDDGVHGHQWVGDTGGVGTMAKARTVPVTVGQAVTIPPILMDGRGTITGVITDDLTHAPLVGAVAGLSTTNAGWGPTRAEVQTDTNGRYTFDDLGPYAWNLAFKNIGYASEFSGNSASSLTGQGVPVQVGQTTTYDVGLGKGVTLHGRVGPATGVPLPKYAFRVTVISAATRDEIGVFDTLEGGYYSIPLFGKQGVKLFIQGSVEGGAFQSFWYGGAADFPGATTIRVPPNGTLTVNIPIPPG